MGFLRSAGIWIVSVILSFCLFLWIFSNFVSFNINDVIGDIYAYADPQYQQQLMGKFNELCAQLSKSKPNAEIDFQDEIIREEDNIPTPISTPRVKKTLNPPKGVPEGDSEGAPNGLLVPKGMPKEEYEKYQEQQGGQQQQLLKLKQLCDQYKNKEISEKQLFAAAITSMMGNLPQIPDIGQLLEKAGPELGEKFGPFNIILPLLKAAKIALPIFIIILFGLLFLFFIHEPLMYIKYLGKMFLRTGIWLVIPYLLIQFYLMANPVDTTPILQGMLGGMLGEETNAGMGGGMGLNMGSIMTTLIPIMLKMIYPLPVFLIGVLFILLGIASFVLFKFVVERPKPETGTTEVQAEKKTEIKEEQTGQKDEKEGKEEIEEKEESNEGLAVASNKRKEKTKKTSKSKRVKKPKKKK